MATDNPLLHPLMAVVSRRANALGRGLAARAADLGLAVTQADGTVRAIPIGAIPVILSDHEIRRRSEMAAHLTSATAKAARWRMAEPYRKSVMAALGPAEQRLVSATAEGPAALAVARVDFLGAPDLFALEVNATIPAMQGYSDIAAHAWLATFAPAQSDVGALTRKNGSNADALQQALVALYAQQRGSEPSRMGLLCRRGDAQLTELHYLRDRFRDNGLEAHVVHPDQLTRRQGYLTYEGMPLPLLYRHLFLSHLDAHPCPDLEDRLSHPDSRGTLVLNRPAPHLEMKSTLAWLSMAAASSELAQAMDLSVHEQSALRTAVPWTRILHESGTDTERADGLARIKAQPEDFVLKRSWSYGGNDVFVGRAHASDGFWSRVHATYPHIDRWEDLVDAAARDARGGGFVVQRAVPRTITPQMLCTPSQVSTADVVTDYAAYASIGTSPAWGGVCRAATTDIVNIVGGGALVPIIRESVADELWKRFNATTPDSAGSSWPRWSVRHLARDSR